MVRSGQDGSDTPRRRRGSDDGGRSHEWRSYIRLAAMVTTSTAVMFALTYTNTFAAEHVRWSEERVYMALLMGAAMTVIMLAYMRGVMYRDDRWNAIVTIGALVIGSTALGLSRSQILVDDVAYMNGMIPHHSIAILTSERADIDDLRVRRLADEIIETQRREIAEMKWLIEDIEDDGAATAPEQAERRPVPGFDVRP